MRIACACVLLIGLCAVSTQSFAADLPITFKLNELKDSNLENFGAVAQDGDKSFRTATKDKVALLKLLNWWGGAIRPPQGTIYVLEVTYKDVATSPVLVDVFAGIASNLGRSELHRFGGANDGQWKVAYIPASWDLLMLRKGATDVEFALRASVDLPISQIVVRLAKLPEDQARYEAETRAWIVKLQAAKTATARHVEKDEVAVLPDAAKAQALVAFARPSYDPIYPNSAPRQGEAGARVHVQMSRNESEPGTFGVYAQDDLTDVTFSVSDLNGTGGKLACDVRCQTVEYSLVTRADEAKKPVLMMVPQRLWEVFPTPIKKGQSCGFYITVKTLGEASKPGVYEGKISIKSSKGTAELPLKVDVLPILLLDMDAAKLKMGGCVSGYASAGELSAMKDHNHNMLNLWFSYAQPLMKMNGDKLELDFYYLDNWMKLASDNGIKTIVWFLGGNPNGYPETLSVERDLWTNALGLKREDFFAKMYTPEQRGKMLPEIKVIYTQLIKQMIDHGKENNWPDLIFTPFDEPVKWAASQAFAEKRKYAIGCGPWIRNHFIEAADVIHAAHPNAKVYASIHHNKPVKNLHGYTGYTAEVFFPHIDIICTNAIGEDPELGNKVRKAGKEFWQYSGTGSGRYNFGFFFGKWDSRGSLCWAYNWTKRFDVSEGEPAAYAWYSPFSTVLTPNYEDYREAWDDRRYMETAKAAAKTAGVDISALIEQIGKEVLADKAKGGQDTVTDFWEAGRNACKMDQWRKMLSDKIIELKK